MVHGISRSRNRNGLHVTAIAAIALVAAGEPVAD